MRIVLATAEPRGAYHLAPLLDALASHAHHYTHLVPYPEPVQGTPLADTTSDPGVLDTADRVVITGGTLSAWTTFVGWRAHQLQLPVIYSELAGVSPHRNISISLT